MELFPDPKKLGQQLKYADRRGFRVAVIAGGNEFAAGLCQVKDLRPARQRDVPLDFQADGIVAAIQALLAGTGENGPSSA